MNLRGFTLITGILLLMSVMLIGLISISSLNWTSGKIQTYYQRNQELAAVSDACLEEGVLRLKQDAAFRTATLSILENSCKITLSAPSNNTYPATIGVTGSQGESLSVELSLLRIVQGQSTQVRVTTYKNL